MLVVLALVAGGAYAAWRWLGQDDETDTPAQAEPSEVCRTPTVKPPAELLDPATVTVNVANGTSRPGLAVQTADRLAAQGFLVEQIGNTDRPVKQGVAQVRYATDDLDAAVTIAAYVPGAQLQPVQKAPSPALWLGPEFTTAQQGITSTGAADLTSVTMPTLDPVCRTPRS
jgi:hypothetical protein